MPLTLIAGLTRGRWSSMRRRASLVALMTLGGVAAATPAQAATFIDTTGSWDGRSVICSFGRASSGDPSIASSMGQTVTVPAQDAALDSYTVFMIGTFGPATLVFRGEVYAWDGTKAVGRALWEGKPRTLTLSPAPQAVTFTPGGVSLIAGQRYILFASVSRDFEKNADPSEGCWGFVLQTDGLGNVFAPDVYAGGQEAFLDDRGDESLWTRVPWGLVDGDLAFKASFKAVRRGEGGRST